MLKKKKKTFVLGRGYVIEDLKICLCIFVVSEYQNSPLQLFESEEHNSDTRSRGNVLWFYIFLVPNKQFRTN